MMIVFRNSFVGKKASFAQFLSALNVNKNDCFSAETGKNASGFTLMEILVSMAVISIVLVSLFRVQSGSIDLTAAGRFHNTAPLLAQQQLAVIENKLEDVEDSQGEFEPPFENFTWECRISEVELNGIDDLPENDSGLIKKIVLEIGQKDTNRLFRVETFRTRSDQS